MTKETKIGLLVGMGFIILIGILVSDHLSEAQKQQPGDMRWGNTQDLAYDSSSRGDNTPMAPPEMSRRDNLNQNLPEDQVDIEPGVYQGGGAVPPRIETDVNESSSAENYQPEVIKIPPVVPNGDELPPVNGGNSGSRDTGSIDSNPNFEVVTPPTVNSGRKMIEDKKPENKATESVKKGREHHIKSNETLSDISKAYYGTTKHWRLIAEYNKKEIPNPNVIREGVRIVIPDLPSAKKETVKKSPVVKKEEAKPEPRYGSYTVKSGDVLSKLAARFYGKQSAWPDLYKLNKSVIDDPDRLKPGTVLKVPQQ